MKSSNSPINVVLEWVRQNRILSVFFAIAGALTLAVVGSFLFEWIRDTVLPWLGSTEPPNYLVTAFIIILGTIIGLIVGVVISANSFSSTANFPPTWGAINYDAAKMRIYWLLMLEINSLTQKSLRIINDENLTSFIQEYFYKMFEYIGGDCVRGGAIFLRNQDNPNFLYYWRGSDTKKGGSEKEFFIGAYTDDKEKYQRGTAGTVFIEDRPRIVNIMAQKEGKADDSTYHRFNKKPTSQYDSFVAFPIHMGNKVVGVLTLESLKKYVFEQEDLPILQCFADMVGDVLFHYKLVA